MSETGQEVVSGHDAIDHSPRDFSTTHPIDSKLKSEYDYKEIWKTPKCKEIQTQKMLNECQLLLFVFCFIHTVFTLIWVWQSLRHPLRLWMSWQDGRAPTRYPSSPATKENQSNAHDWKAQRDQQKRERMPLVQTIFILPHNSCPGSFYCFGGNFTMSVAARKSIPTWFHLSMKNSLEICICQHRLAFHLVAIPIAFQSTFCQFFHWLQ